MLFMPVIKLLLLLFFFDGLFGLSERILGLPELSLSTGEPLLVDLQLSTSNIKLCAFVCVCVCECVSVYTYESH